MYLALFVPQGLLQLSRYYFRMLRLTEWCMDSILPGGLPPGADFPPTPDCAACSRGLLPSCHCSAHPQLCCLPILTSYLGLQPSFAGAHPPGGSEGRVHGRSICLSPFIPGKCLFLPSYLLIVAEYRIPG